MLSRALARASCSRSFPAAASSQLQLQQLGGARSKSVLSSIFGGAGSYDSTIPNININKDTRVICQGALFATWER